MITQLSGGRVRIIGMRFWGQHGVSEEERSRAQPIDVDVELGADLGPAAASDKLDAAIDYDAVYRACEGVVTKQSFALLEALAAKIGETIFQDERAQALTVRVRKPRLLDGATPEIEVRLTR